MHSNWPNAFFYLFLSLQCKKTRMNAVTSFLQILYFLIIVSLSEAGPLDVALSWARADKIPIDVNLPWLPCEYLPNKI